MNFLRRESCPSLTSWTASRHKGVVLYYSIFPLLKCKEFHSEFRLLEVTKHEELTDKITLHFFELPKIPNDINDKNMLLLWLSLFKAETKDEIERQDEAQALRNARDEERKAILELLKSGKSHDEIIKELETE